MRIDLLFRNAFLFLFMASPALLAAQFQQPTNNELKMTADPKAPGAAAVYLNIEDITDDARHYRSYYARIKVLQEKGKDLATVEMPYMQGFSKVTDIQARTIHADGTVIPLVGKPDDLLTTRTADLKLGRKVFNLPSVEVGSILEYYFQLHYDYLASPFWEIQRPYFVHKARYVFTPFNAFLTGTQDQTNMYVVDGHGARESTLMWLSRLPPGVTIKSEVSGRRSVELTDVPPAPGEEWMPPMHSFLYRVRFYYTSATTPGVFWVDEANHWSKDVDHFAEPTNLIKQAAAGLIAASDPDLEKAKKLYKAVQALDNTDFSRKKTESELKQLKLKPTKRAEDTWSQKNGSSEDIALLYLALLRGAGLTAYAIKVVDREQGIFDPTYLSFGQLDDTLVILSLGGQEIFLDPGEKMCPFQTMHWRHAGAQGIRQSAAGRTIKTTALQSYSENTILRTAEIALDTQGAMTGTLRITMTGQEALRWRQIALANDLDEVKNQFHQWIDTMIPEGVEAVVDRLAGLDDPYVDLVAEIGVRGTLGAATSKRVLLPAFFFETRSHQPFIDQEKRQSPVDMHYGDQVIDQAIYHLPKGMVVEATPKETKIEWPEHVVLMTKTESSPGQIALERGLYRNFTFAKPEEYQDLRGFYQKVAAADQQQIVLTASPTTKGN
jgi:hypothetical protein